MTSSSEARVPHDPADLRDAAYLQRVRGIVCSPQLADRLEAWADDLERLAPLEAADKVRELVLDGVRSMYPEAAGGGWDEWAFDYDAMVRAARSLAPLEAAVLDAAKAWCDATVPATVDATNALYDAVMALQEATDG